MRVVAQYKARAAGQVLESLRLRAMAEGSEPSTTRTESVDRRGPCAAESVPISHTVEGGAERREAHSQTAVRPSSAEGRESADVSVQAALAESVSPESGLASTEAHGRPLNAAEAAQQARAQTVAKLIRELDHLKPQMLEDEAEYNKLRAQYIEFLCFKIAENRPDLKLKILGIRGSVRHIRLAQELAGAHYGRQLSTIQEDWKNFKPEEFRRPD
jgi:hypothetical protein